MSTRNTRLEILIPADRRDELDRLSAETGLPAAAIVRAGIAYVLEHQHVLPKPTPEAHPHV
jgi:hypothetical protein